MDFEIELEPHIGERMVDGQVQQFELDQYQIVVTGEKLKEVRGVNRLLIGYVGKKPGAPINYLKVAAAFGPSVKVFTQMVRHGLLAKLRERVARAREAQAEAEKLKEEADALAEEERALAAEADAADAARQLAEAAIEEASKELDEASQQVAKEESVERRAFEPDPAVIAESARTSARTSAAAVPSIDELAESQNL